MLSSLIKMAKSTAMVLLGNYSIYIIYSKDSDSEIIPSQDTTGLKLTLKPIDRAAIINSPNRLIQEQAGYAGNGSCTYACISEKQIVGICAYWFGNRYKKRNFWPLKQKEAKLVQIITLPEMRGIGIAPNLIFYSSQDMVRKGFTQLYARIWFSHGSSLRAFQKAGWKKTAILAEINPLRTKKPIRIRLNSIPSFN